jgi:hypothetical protein
MASQPKRPGTKPEIDEETRRILDERIDASEKDTDFVSRKQLLEEGLRELKTPVRR